MTTRADLIGGPLDGEFIEFDAGEDRPVALIQPLPTIPPGPPYKSVAYVYDAESGHYHYDPELTAVGRHSR